MSFPEPWGMKRERSTRGGLVSPIEGARPSTGFSLASSWLYPPAFQALQIPGTHSGRYRLFPPWPRLIPLPPVNGLSLAKESVRLVPRPEYSSHLRPKGMFRACAWAEDAGHPCAKHRQSLDWLLLFDALLGTRALAPRTQAPRL